MSFLFTWCNVDCLVLWPVMFRNLYDKKLNNSCLLMGSRRNDIQLDGFVSPATFRRTPLPIFSLEESSRLLGRYVSQTTSTRLHFWLLSWGKKTISAYSFKGRSTTTAPSRTLQSNYCGVSPWVVGSRNCRSSDLVFGGLRRPNSDREGRNGNTSWLKKSWRSALQHYVMAMYSCANSATLFWRTLIAQE